MRPMRSMSIFAVVVVVFGFGWWQLAPREIGGRDSYFILSGTSMLPALQTGDLVVLRPASSYRVGEVAAYLTPQLKAPILHQIVGVNAGRYAFKGENNAFVDPSHPSQKEIIGRLWLNLGPMGRILLGLKKPALGAPLLGFAASFALWPKYRSRRRRLRRYGYET